MEKVALGNSGRQTTRLGFGCSSLMGAMGSRDSLAILEEAFNSGIRHFDVAPMYGYGHAEGCLGEFQQRHRNEITITTKYGIPAPKNASLVGIARPVVRAVLKRVPGLKQRLAGAARAVTHTPQKASFTAAQAKASLDRSLTALRTDRIDVWLLHEVEANDLQDDHLLHLLEEETTKGTIGTFGVGSEACKINELLTSHPAYCQILQYEWSVFDPPDAENKPFCIHHRALTQNFRSIHHLLTSQTELCRRWSTEVGVDLSDQAQLASLMLKAALVMNPSSVILFSSKNPKHIRENVRIAGERGMEEPARKFYSLVRAERDKILPSAENGNS
ncbi:MAG TPA: aldo/keto reductase [Edaphobacter sp.]|nr:aldo/keto reductase [Edaphobacter sp.]